MQHGMGKQTTGHFHPLHTCSCFAIRDPHNTTNMMPLASFLTCHPSHPTPLCHPFDPSFAPPPHTHLKLSRQIDDIMKRGRWPIPPSSPCPPPGSSTYKLVGHSMKEVVAVPAILSQHPSPCCAANPLQRMHEAVRRKPDTFQNEAVLPSPLLAPPPPHRPPLLSPPTAPPGVISLQALPEGGAGPASRRLSDQGHQGGKGGEGGGDSWMGTPL